MAGGVRVGKRLTDRLRWLREEPGADTYGPEAWQREALRCAQDGDPPPDRDEWMERSSAAGWAPLDALHEELLSFEAGRAALGDLAMDGSCGPVLEWPSGWGAWSLVEHRRAISAHWKELERIQLDEARQARAV